MVSAEGRVQQPHHVVLQVMMEQNLDLQHECKANKHDNVLLTACREFYKFHTDPEVGVFQAEQQQNHEED